MTVFSSPRKTKYWSEAAARLWAKLSSRGDATSAFRRRVISARLYSTAWVTSRCSVEAMIDAWRRKRRSKHSANGLKRSSEQSSPRSRSASYSKLQYQSPVLRSLIALCAKYRLGNPCEGGTLAQEERSCTR